MNHHSDRQIAREYLIFALGVLDKRKASRLRMIGNCHLVQLIESAISDGRFSDADTLQREAMRRIIRGRFNGEGAQ